MALSREAPRLDNLISWFAASVMVTAGVIYALKLQDGRREQSPQRVLPRASPAQEPLRLQQTRAAERGRGRRADTPLHIPWAGWKDILLRTYGQIQNDRLLALAAGVVFYSLVALVPALAAGVSVYALFANAAVAIMLYRFRSGDANMRSVWICSRNDAIGNAAVLLAAVGVFGTGTAWPDLAVAAIMALLALSGGIQIIRQARGELAGADQTASSSARTA